MREMQAGNMMGALSDLGLDMGSYTNVMTEWGGALQKDPTLKSSLKFLRKESWAREKIESLYIFTRGRRS